MFNTPLAAGIRYAADHGAKVLNISEGIAAAATPEVVAAVNYALGKDVVIVAANGNLEDDKSNVISSPANVPGVIAVSGTDQDNNAWSGSVTGAATVLSAPATSLISSATSSFSPSGFQIGDGTSGSTALITGVAALVRAKYPDLDAANVINRLISTAKSHGGRDSTFGYGEIDPVAALTASVPSVTKNPLITAAAGSTAGPGDDATPTPKKSHAPFITVGVTSTSGAIIQGGVALVSLIAIVGLIIYFVRQARRNKIRRYQAAAQAAQAAHAAQAGWRPPGPPGPGGPPTGPMPGGPPTGPMPVWPGQQGQPGQPGPPGYGPQTGQWRPPPPPRS